MQLDKTPIAGCMTSPLVLNVSHSALGQPWHWRGGSPQVAAAIAQRFGVSEVVGRLLAARGVAIEEAGDILNPSLRHWLPDPAIFKGMEDAVTRIHAAIEKQQYIVIFGDYDVDGATSAALLVRYFRSIGVTCGTYIPDRLLEGYGPSTDALEALKQAGTDLVITVDCGTQSYEALTAAHAAGLDVIVVDHHKASSELPLSRALINPNRLDESAAAAAFGHLAAVGVAFLLVVALNRALRQAGRFTPSRPEPSLIDLLDVVALGTVADVVPLTGLNRAFVTQGLKVLARREQPGLTALMDVAGLTKAPDAGSLGFHLGPRINAGGRVGEANLGVRLLTTDDPGEARQIALRLNDLNSERRVIEAMVQAEAQAMAEAQLARNTPPVITVAGEAWHPGVIGIVAGRLKETFGRPVIVLSLDGGIGKGSGRSISGVDLGAAVIAAKAAGLLSAGGGHAMAAGLTVARAAIPPLTEFLNNGLAAQVQRARAERGLAIDAVTAPAGITADLARAVAGAGPYGVGWPSPRLATGPVRVIKADVVGDAHIRLIASGADGARLKAVAFRQLETDLGQCLLGARGAELHLAGRITLDDWGGRDAAELHIEDAAAA